VANSICATATRVGVEAARDPGSLELLVDVARDRRLLLLEVAVVFLILLELIFTILPLFRIAAH